MAQITAEQRRRYGFLLTGSVPDAVLKAIDDRELEDRLAQASGLMQQVAKAATPGAGRYFGEQAQRVLAARPRSETERLVQSKITKARSLGTSPQAADLERQAREELLAHPPAVRRFDPARIIQKAKDDGQLFACFDSAGRLYGVVDPKEIQLVDDDGGSDPAATGGNAAPAQAGSPQQAVPAPAAPQPVAKAAAKNPMKAVYNQQGRLMGLVDPAVVQEVLITLPGAAEVGDAIAKARARMPRIPVAKDVPAGHIAIYDSAGQLKGYVRPGDIADPASAQARNRGPVNAGGTTGLGQPRVTGPAAASPADGPQQARRGDPAGRQVVKAAAAQAARRRAGR